MKKSFSKRLLSMFLSILMIVTTVPAFVLTDEIEAKADVNYGEDDAYLFAYFTGDNEGQKVKFALSSDGLNFSPVNGNDAVLRNDPSAVYPAVNDLFTITSGTKATTGGESRYPASGYARDPFIFKKVDGSGYWIVATDLHVVDNEDYNNTKLLVWDVPDLAHADQVQPWNIECAALFKNTYNRAYTGSGNIVNNYNVEGDDGQKNFVAWAPEVTYDYSKNMYMLYWSGPFWASSTIRYAYTMDFQTFYRSDASRDEDTGKITGTVIDGSSGNEPETLYSNGSQNVIDGDIVYDATKDRYYLFYKWENDKSIYVVKSSSNTITSLTGQPSTKINISGTGLTFEGPEVYQRDDGKWVLITDMYSANPKWDFYMFAVDDLDEYMSGEDFAPKRITTTNINDCLPRHGAVAKIDTQTYYDIATSYAIPSDFPNQKAKAVGQFKTGESNTEQAPNYYKNLLYSNMAAKKETTSSSTSTTPRITFAAANPESTLLYDGINTAQTAAMVGFTFNSSGNYTRYVYSAYVNNSSNELAVVNDKWKVYDGSGSNWDYCWVMYNGNFTLSTVTAPDSSSGYQIRNGRNNVNDGKAFGANCIKYTGGEFPSGTYLKTLYPVYHGYSGGDSTFNRVDIYQTITSNQPIYVVNYKPIADRAQEVKDKFDEVIATGLDAYCPESLDAYLAAVGKVTKNIQEFFYVITSSYTNANAAQDCAAYIQDVVENGALDLAIEGPQLARIQFGNLFDFDAFATSASAESETNTHLPVEYIADQKIVRITGGASGYLDSYTTNAYNINTYKIPVTPGQKYVFEFTCNNQYGDLMLFVPNDEGTNYDPSFVGVRPQSAGDAVHVTQTVNGKTEYVHKQEFTAPAGKNYVYFRTGLVGTDIPTDTVTEINRIRLYKSAYENWASRAPQQLVGTECTVPGNKVIGYIEYGQDLPVPSTFDDKHFCYWCEDETLNNRVTKTTVDGKVVYQYTEDGTTKTLSGCQVLYAKYADLSEAYTEDQNIVAPTCTTDGSKDVVTFCGNCNAELSRVNVKNGDATDHDIAYKNPTADGHTVYCTKGDLTEYTEAHQYTDTTSGTTVIHTCDLCGYSYSTVRYTYDEGTNSFKAEDGSDAVVGDFTVYDATEKVYQTLNLDKFTVAGTTYLNDAHTAFLAVKNNVYYSNAGDGQTSTSQVQTDIDNAVSTFIAAMNTAKANPEDTFINKYTVTIQVQSDDDSSTVLATQTLSNQLYGTVESLTVAGISSELDSAGYYPIAWKVTETKQDSTTVTKLGAVDTYDVVVTGDLDIILTVSKDETLATGYTIKVVDNFNKFVETVSSETQPTKGIVSNSALNALATVSAPAVIPFYTFSGNWFISYNSETDIYTAKPKYNIIPTHHIDVIGGTVTGVKCTDGNAVYDSVVKLTANESGIYGWVAQSDEKYQIVSYSEEYEFNACNAETYIPFIKDGSVYKLMDAGNTVLTASNVEGISDNKVVGSLTADQFLNAKLDQQLPFAYIEKACFIDVDENGKYKARAYARITEGYSTENTKNFNYGVNYTATVNGTTKSKMVPSTNALAYSGQFVFSLNSSLAFTSATYTAYANYDFTYTLGGQTVTVNVNDISASKDCE